MKRRDRRAHQRDASAPSPDGAGVAFNRLTGWRAASAEALSRWAGLFDAADVEGFGAWAPSGLTLGARLDAETVGLGALTCVLTAAGTDLVFARGGVVDLEEEGARQRVDLFELYTLLYLRTSRRPVFASFASRWAFIVGELDAIARLGGATLREGLSEAARVTGATGGDA